MKRLLLCPALLLGSALAAHAQVLPVPGGKNPDWVLFGTYKKPYDGQAVAPPSASRMPNAAGKSIMSHGNSHYYWDADRQLAYEWYSRDATLKPIGLVNVRVQQQDIVYAYRPAKNPLSGWLSSPATPK